MRTLVITLADFSIERALSPRSEQEGVPFRSFIDEAGSISPQKLVGCMNPELKTDQLDYDTTFNLDDSYKKSKPSASLIEIANIKELDDHSIRFDVKFVFEGFRAKNEEECLQDLIDGSEDIGTYALQLKEEILKGYGLRNNRNPKPKVSIEYL